MHAGMVFILWGERMYVDSPVRVHVHVGITSLCSQSHLHQGSGEPLTSQDPVQVSNQQASI